MPAKTNAQRQADLRKRRRAAGVCGACGLPTTREAVTVTEAIPSRLTVNEIQFSKLKGRELERTELVVGKFTAFRNRGSGKWTIWESSGLSLSIEAGRPREPVLANLSIEAAVNAMVELTLRARVLPA